jgi:hypothetical protein
VRFGLGIWQISILPNLFGFWGTPDGIRANWKMNFEHQTKKNILHWGK